jgi:hypothetical protein
MTHLQSIHAHALYMRVRARALQAGDEEAREHARQLIEQAEKVDPQPKTEESAS